MARLSRRVRGFHGPLGLLFLVAGTKGSGQPGAGAASARSLLMAVVI
jgi:hypothetical protein